MHAVAVYPTVYSASQRLVAYEYRSYKDIRRCVGLQPLSCHAELAIRLCKPLTLLVITWAQNFWPTG